MARTEIPIQEVADFGGGIDDVTFTSGDAANDMYFENDGRTILLVSASTSSGQTITVVSVADPFGRTGDKSITVPTNGTSVRGPFAPTLYNQGGSNKGRVHVDMSDDTGVSFAAVRLLGA